MQGSPDLPSAEEALTRLLEGNQRFASGKPERPHQSPEWWKSLTTQHPFACVLGCVDSRVPPELVFDQGFGDLFTVRSAGETLDEMVIGSIEYGVEHLSIPLVLILGHSGCGAVSASIGYVKGDEAPRGEIMAVVRAIEGTVRATPGPRQVPRRLRRGAVRPDGWRAPRALRHPRTPRQGARSARAVRHL
ncbi:MAG: carbonic anhydrase [Egibacteraceae bacterium]